MKTTTMMGALMIGVTMVTPAAAQTLNDALSQMLARNSALSAARSQYEAEYKEQFVSLSTMLPKVVGYVQETRSDTNAECYAPRTGMSPASTCDAGDIYEAGDSRTDSDGYGIQVTQDLFTSGKNLNGFRAKRAEIRSKQQDLIQTEQQIILQAIAAYLDVLQADAVRDLNRSNEAVLTKQLEAVRDRFQVGVGTRTDIAQSEARMAAAKSARLASEANAQSARAVYLEVFGIEAGELVQPERLPRMPRSLDRAKRDARRDSPVLGSAQELAAMGRFQSYSTVGGSLPSITLTGTYAHNEDPNGLVGVTTDTTSVVARLNVPLFLGGQSIAAIAASRDVRNALTQNVHSASRAVDRTVVSAWHTYQAADAAIAARQQQIKASETALDGVRQENRLGTRTTLDVLNAEQALLDARVALVQAARDQQVAAYNLLAAMGHLTPKKLRITAADISETPSE